VAGGCVGGWLASKVVGLVKAGVCVDG